MNLAPIGAATLVAGAAKSAASGLSSVSQGFEQLLARALGINEAAPEESEGAAPAKSACCEGEHSQDVTVAKLKQEHDQLLASFHEAISQLAASQGIELSSNFQIEADSFGHLRVSGTTPESGELESALAGDSELSTLFSAIEARAALLRAIEQQSEAGLGDSSQESAANSAARFLIEVDPSSSQSRFAA